jgi:hypothetical protein
MLSAVFQARSISEPAIETLRSPWTVRHPGQAEKRSLTCPQGAYGSTCGTGAGRVTKLRFSLHHYLRCIELHTGKMGFYSLALGTISQSSRYKPMPGTPPGMAAIKKDSRNQKALMPKNSDKPPQTPAKTRLWRERRKEL